MTNMLDHVLLVFVGSAFTAWAGVVAFFGRRMTDEVSALRREVAAHREEGLKRSVNLENRITRIETKLFNGFSK